MATYTGIGCMSGTSLDGLDICCVEFTGDLTMDLWGYRVLQAETIPYTDLWRERLATLDSLNGAELVKLHVDYGVFLGTSVSEFISRYGLMGSINFVASHGHTAFHQPENGFTFQLGEGETTSAFLNVPFVCNFRSKDVALKGQGAPLVPCGERYLFNSTDICINLGGIVNIGFRGHTGYDICPCNMALNRLALLSDKRKLQDEDGELASGGNVLPEVLEKLEDLSFYKQSPPKSLSREWMEDNVDLILDVKKYSVPDLLRTMVEHISTRVQAECEKGKENLRTKNEYSAMVTGGGAFNKFLVKLIREKLKTIHVDLDDIDDETINFKEALVFAFLGLRCLLGAENVFCNVTGAKDDSISGSIHRSLQTGPMSPCVTSRKFSFSLK